MKNYLFLALFLSVFLGISFAAGIGTSKISFSNNSINISQGSSARVNYTVALISGSKWATSMVLLNQTLLLQKGISAAMSNPSSDPTFSGILTISASSATPPGKYNLSFQATGDDPSVNNSVIILNVAAPSASATSSQITNPIVSSQYNKQPAYAVSHSIANYLLYALMLVVLILNIYFIAIMKYFNAKLIFASALLILIGSLAWLYGDINGGLFYYIAAGFAAIIIGTILWLYADYKGGAFKKRQA
ncbi:MAG: hypothetical protein M1331_01710 [Candidatus Marsarchaeota archaeon]|nr:hypothetical protein [Candidatus Marsarchaeota archaeon]MCL5106096.1 hypothetical protein [Candidatus Marsarchaeota archaeon]